MKKYILMSMVLMGSILLAACETDEGLMVSPPSQEVGTPLEGEEKEVAIEHGQRLFLNLINLEAVKNQKEADALLQDTLDDPVAYLKSLDENGIKLKFGRYEKAQAWFSDETVTQLDGGPNGNVEYHGFALVKMTMKKGEEPVESPFEVTLKMGFDPDEKVYRVLKADIEPQ